jgi:hypothetical protein
MQRSEGQAHRLASEGQVCCEGQRVRNNQAVDCEVAG